MTNVPNWIEQDISACDVAAIIQGGCAGGRYMPAVTYATATAIMVEHGDDVLKYLVDQLGELPRPDVDIAWSAMAAHFLSAAVECWAIEHEHLANWEDDTPLLG